MDDSGDREFFSLNLKALFSRGHWRYVIILTYSFDLPFFETYLLPMMVQNGSRSITIAADAEWLAQRLPIWLERDQIREAGKRYMLCGVNVPGAFHPKVLLAANKTNGTVVIGSGNMSPYGMAKGGELFTSIEWQDQQIPSLAREIWAFYNVLASTLPIDEYFFAKVQEMGNFVRGLTLPPNGQLLRHNLHESLLDQVVREVASKEVSDLLLWSPFTDEKLIALKALVARLQPKSITLALQPGITNIDGASLQAFAGSQSQIMWRFVELLQSSSSTQHMIHAKGILITLASGEEILLAGSPNLSKPALLETVNQGNMEIAILFRGQNIYHRLFAQGPIRLGGLVDSQTLYWKSNILSETQTSKKAEVILLGATLQEDLLRLNVQGYCPPTSQVSLDNSQRLLPLVSYQGGLFETHVLTNTNLHFVKLVWDGGESNAVIIAHVKDLTENAQETTPSRRISLIDLIEGGDTEWILFMQELAELVIIDPYDVVRYARGLQQPTLEEEAQEAGTPLSPEDFNNIDFKAAMQRYISQSGVSALSGSHYYTPSSYWLDEITSYFKNLSEQQQKRALRPDVDGGSNEGTLEPFDEPMHPIPLIPVSKRIQTLLRNRIRRVINGLRTPLYYQQVPYELIVTTYIRFLNLFELLWKRLQNANTAIFNTNEHSSLCLEFLSAFWGSDLEPGYWISLDDDQMFDAGLKLIDTEADALTLASINRILNNEGEASRKAPFVVATIVQDVEPLGLFTLEAAERALVYLDQPEYGPALLLQRTMNTQYYFSWNHYLQLLSQRYHLRKATLEDRGFQHGKTLVIDTSKDAFTATNVLAVFADWIQVCFKQDSNRYVFQMYWGESKDLLIYSKDSMKLLIRRSDTMKWINLCSGVPPSEFATWSSIPLLAAESNDGKK